MNKLLVDRTVIEQAVEALNFQNILNICGKYSVVDPKKASEAWTNLLQVLNQKDREWVGLTDEEKSRFVIPYFYPKFDRETAVDLLKEHEILLKEKNT